jgi:hypothetical protein
MTEKAGEDLLPESDLSSFDTVLDKILQRYVRHFDIERGNHFLGVPLLAMAQFHSRGERYVLTHRAKLWAVESHEYALFFGEENFSQERFEAVVSLIETGESSLVKPHSEHMYTFLTGVVLTRGLDREVAKLVKRYKWRKSYKFSIHGWCHIRLAVIDLDSGEIVTNRDGKDLKKMLRGAL